jgi:uncharacterized protein (DUF1800 family)
MLNFLNNQQNKKDHPNENFAREVMELFTMGRGNYTEKDIREEQEHLQDGDLIRKAISWKEKNFMMKAQKLFRKTGNFTGTDALNIILEQKATSKFITTKIYKFFVNENVDEAIVNTLSESFTNLIMISKN